jgi:hypothetical protein
VPGILPLSKLINNLHATNNISAEAVQGLFAKLAIFFMFSSVLELLLEAGGIENLNAPDLLKLIEFPQALTILQKAGYVHLLHLHNHIAHTSVRFDLLVFSRLCMHQNK